MTDGKQSFPLGVQHKGSRFHIGSQADGLRLLFTMVRDGVCTVEQAMDCFIFDDDGAADDSSAVEP